MWWNIIPSWFITGGLIYVPVLFCTGSSYIFFGSIYGREMDTNLHRYLLFRDQKILNGAADPCRQHKFLGLDGVPDN